jgi:hypothetical protein
MSNRLHTGLWAATLAIALLGWTPLGQAAGSAVAKVVPFAKVAGFANNAGALNGHASSRRPKAGQIPVLNTSGKLPASIGAVGPTGPAGAAGAAGAAGPSGVSGYQQVTKQVTFSENGADTTVSCPGGKSVLSGGYNLNSANDNLTVFDSRPVSASDWRFRIRNTTQGNGTVTLFAVCATVTS